MQTEERVDRIASFLRISKATVDRVVGGAKKAGAIKTRVDIGRIFDTKQRIPQLEQTLTQEFPLDSAYVVDLLDEFSNPGSFNLERDTWLHEILGRVSASVLPSIIRHRDKIGVSGGRALGSMAEELIRSGGLSQKKDITFYALAGGSIPLSQTKDKSPSANVVAYTLSDNPQLASYSFFLRRPEQDGVEAKGGLLNLFNRPANIELNVAIFGVGNVHEDFQHFILEMPIVFPEREWMDVSGYWQRLKQEVNSLSVYGLQFKGKPFMIAYNPVVEYLNNMEVVMPPHSMKIPGITEQLKGLEEVTRGMNRHAVGLSAKELKDIPIRVAVAGGVHKLIQIYYAISSGLANFLVTDKLTAETLISFNKIA